MSRGLAGKGNDVNPANPDEQLSDRGLPLEVSEEGFTA